MVVLKAHPSVHTLMEFYQAHYTVFYYNELRDGLGVIGYTDKYNSYVVSK